ncbi:12021_t:CDS:2 [Funneliformis mosseae]|uniref:12021_t:CDS:1 n=1 Tax=Funneliformis mosseae TaxID=27381 RepID=A0A9N9CK28_FUNMO|nr:12021_t:CDS:2 [Funneliformis mosseae]
MSYSIYGQNVMVLQLVMGKRCEVISQINFQLGDKLRMATEITRGLMCLHAEQIIHRDLELQILGYQRSLNQNVLSSDIYGLDNLFWEASIIIFGISFLILENKRKSPVERTPATYVKLYQRCLDNEAGKRPNIEEAS